MYHIKIVYALIALLILLGKTMEKSITTYKERIISHSHFLEKDTFFILFPIFWAAGIALYFGITIEPPIWVGLTCTIASGLTIIYLRHYYPFVLIAISTSIIFAGFTLAQYRTSNLTIVSAEIPTQVHRYQGRIAQIEKREKGHRITLDEMILQDKEHINVPQTVRLTSWADVTHLSPGQTVSFRAKLSSLPPPVAPGAFDFQRYIFFKGIGALGVIFGNVQIITTPEPNIDSIIYDWQETIKARILKTLAATPNTSGIAIALLTGDRSYIDQQDLKNIRVAGLAHLLAISGLHIGLFSACIFFFCRFILAHIPPIALRFPIKKWAAGFGIAAAIFFTLLTGASIPAQRACIMVIIAFCGILLDRKAISIRTTSIAACLILIVRPESLITASFQLSFMAVTALICFYEYWTTHVERKINPIKASLLTSGIATLATNPIAAFHFNQFAFYGILSNLIAVPLTVFWIMSCGFTALALIPFGYEGFFIQMMGQGIALLLKLSTFVVSLPYSDLNIPSVPTFYLVFFCIGLIGVCLSPFKYKTYFALLIMAAIASPIWSSKPDILISPSGHLIGFNTPNTGIKFNQTRSEKYTQQKWLEITGHKVGANQGLFDQDCDNYGCVAQHKGKVVIISYTPAGDLENCQKADILIAPNHNIKHACPHPAQILSKSDFTNHGAHSLQISEYKITKRQTREADQSRPWIINTSE